MAATLASRSGNLILSTSKPLRLLTLILFYFTQGFPVGLFFYAVPAWMSANGASTAQVASVVSAASMPWTIKLINGFLIDRYTFLPMGRRRAWIIGAQSVAVLVLLAGALVAPAASNVFLLSALAFGANSAITFQDVGIDSLAVDIMPDDERAKAAGIMFGAQLLGMATATSLGGYLFQHAGITVALGVLAGFPLLVALYGVAIRERPGERRLPWTAGSSHPRNVGIQVDAWRPLLKSTGKSLLVPLTLAIVPILLLRSVPSGGFEAFHPALFTRMAGWQISEYTSLVSTSQMISGVAGLLIGGALIDRIGTRAGLVAAASLGAAVLFIMGLAKPLWGETWLLVSLQISADLIGLLYNIAVIPICMRLCSPRVAATQFTIYMALGNFGRPIGASLAAMTAGNGLPEWLYYSGALGWTVVAVLAFMVRFPVGSQGEAELVHDLPDAGGIAPKMD
ncbi:MFS transporter [Novosphingobium sp.]|uniref:MFS transporter n=1 Tax=Novosphingobium sp. TaxID=1874826 RepID=UPI0025CFA044|nr:MFS transporter [Novosphingobium sp.]